MYSYKNKFLEMQRKKKESKDQLHLITMYSNIKKKKIKKNNIAWTTVYQTLML